MIGEFGWPSIHDTEDSLHGLAISRRKSMTEASCSFSHGANLSKNCSRCASIVGDDRICFGSLNMLQ